jgi:Mlc titration factor MtfA (ptsG expression regulator)
VKQRCRSLHLPARPGLPYPPRVFSWLRDRRRRAILAKGFPPAWEAHLPRHLACWERLGGECQRRLRELTQVFVAEKHWEGCGGLELDDEMRVAIAAQACLLVLELPHDLYRQVDSILVYPSTVAVPDHAQPGGVRSDSPMPVLGLAVPRGPVVLAWDAVERGSRHPEQTHNVVFHEFAHKLDMLDDSLDGTPPLASREEYARWVEVCTREYEALRRAEASGRRSFLDGYGATNVAEFFAVVTEAFFDEPREMRRRHPELYAVLAAFYRQDPAADFRDA